MATKYSKDLLENLVKESTSFLEVTRKLGIISRGNMYTNIKNRIKEFNIDTSHFLGKGSNKYGRYYTGKLEPNMILVYNRLGRREQTHILRRALTESGIKEKCVICNIGAEWNNLSLILEIDHINGNGLDNRIENLRFLCPNCHSQTENFGNKNRNN